MINTNKIKGKIAEIGFTRESLAEAVGMTRATLRNKLSGESDFTVSEAAAMRKALNLNDEEFLLLFFYEECPLNGTQREEGA